MTKQGWTVRRLADNPGEAILRAEAEAVAAENASLRDSFLELNNLEERGIPLLIVGPEQSELVSKPMEKIMRDILVP